MTRFRITLSNTNSSSSSSSSAAEAPPPETATVEPDMVVILAALICALICVVGFIAVAKCPWLRRSSNGSSTRSTTSPASANKGLKKKILQSFPKFKYSSDITSSSAKLGSECAICLSEFADGDELRMLPQCGHGFHLGCIDTWLKSHSSCPSCRQILGVVRCEKCGQVPGRRGGGVGGTQVELNQGKHDIPSSSSNSNSNCNENGFLP